MVEDVGNTEMVKRPWEVEGCVSNVRLERLSGK